MKYNGYILISTFLLSNALNQLPYTIDQLPTIPIYNWLVEIKLCRSFDKITYGLAVVYYGYKDVFQSYIKTTSGVFAGPGQTQFKK